MREMCTAHLSKRKMDTSGVPLTGDPMRDALTMLNYARDENARLRERIASLEAQLKLCNRRGVNCGSLTECVVCRYAATNMPTCHLCFAYVCDACHHMHDCAFSTSVTK